ncbi:hypothetical protein MIMGU_mgv1a005990mg [Erythranthe guttata]|uniref:Uncharacterized protein n=1 Tax=Erythranthe guttata TaxID=4155 RepID=A0A022R9S9_ERYGU|nr:hypothetical protein MIMGU_mgv1a005990mg [Erythranthe guttata]
MGKSAVSCFRIITCASESNGNDDLQSKVSNDRRGWSFRKRTATHRVLSNTVISEAPSSANNHSPGSTSADFSVQPSLTVAEKNSAVQCTEEKYKSSAQIESKFPDIIVAREDECRADETLDDSSIILIQSAIRAYLARRLLLKQKKVINLQHETENLEYCDGKDGILVPTDFHSAETSENDNRSITYDLTDSANSLLDKDETGNGQDIPNLEKFYIEQSETEAKGFSEKASNPDFIYAQSKSAKLTSEQIKTRDIGVDDSSISNASSVQIAASECGTELSISSTLDSPDRSEAGFNDLEKESKISDKANEKSSVLCTELSPEESPRSIVESQRTPSSQVSVNLKKSKGEKTESANSKNRSSSGDKRRNSFGSPKPDQEPRDSSSSNSLPSYMQVTESAKAKAISNGFQRSSPDALVKDIFVKKRHSLPAGTNGRQGSNAKGNEIHSPQGNSFTIPICIILVR